MAKQFLQLKEVKMGLPALVRFTLGSSTPSLNESLKPEKHDKVTRDFFFPY